METTSEFNAKISLVISFIWLQLKSDDPHLTFLFLKINSLANLDCINIISTFAVHFIK